jgi:hypothetical protein
VACIATVVLLCGSIAVAQVHLGGLSLNAGGSLGAGYSGDYGQNGSDHGTTLSGGGTIGGYYYTPTFASFSVSPYYGRSQDGSLSIANTSGYSETTNLFSGSHFPVGIGIGQHFNSTGQFGIPGSSGLTTNSSDHEISLGTDLRFSGLPEVSLSYGQSGSSNSVYGSAGGSEGTAHGFGIKSAYKLAGFTFGGGYSHQVTDVTSTILAGSTPDVSDTALNTLSFSAGHSLPFHGGFGVGFSRSDYKFHGSDGESDTGTTDNLSLNANVLVGRFPISVSGNYSDNLFGSVVVQSINNSIPVYQNTLSPESRSMIITATTSYILLRRVFMNGYINYQDEYLNGQSYAATQYGVTAHYNFSKRIKGLSVTLGITDAADKSGNEGVGLVSNVNYSRAFGAWTFDANFNYSQSVQTMLAMYTMSTMNYSSSVRRTLAKGIHFSLGGGGGHSGFNSTPGNGTASESLSSNISWKGYSLGGTYSVSNGTSVLTANGLQTVTLPIVPASDLVVYNATQYGASGSLTPFRHLSISGSYSNGRSNSVGTSLVNTRTETMNGFCTYRFRQLNFEAGYVALRQNVQASDQGQTQAGAMQHTYYFGISRWFKFF